MICWHKRHRDREAQDDGTYDDLSLSERGHRPRAAQHRPDDDGRRPSARRGGRSGHRGHHDPGPDPARWRALAGALTRATGAGAVVILAAPAWEPDAVSPSRQDGVVRVGAVAADDRLAGEYVPGAVDVLAPGVNVLTTGEGGEIEATGTDFAVPFVAGLAALIRAAEPELSPAAVAQRVMNSADGGVAAIVVNRAVTSGSRRQQRHEQPGG